MEYGKYGNLINFSDKNQAFSLNHDLINNFNKKNLVLNTNQNFEEDKCANLKDLEKLQIEENNTNNKNILEYKSCSSDSLNNNNSSENDMENVNNPEKKKKKRHHNHSCNKDINNFYDEKILKKFMIEISSAIEFFDFNRAVHTKENELLSKTDGNYFFYAPECCQGGSSFLGKPIDIWALGVTLYTAFYKRLPFLPKNTHNYPELFNLIANKEIEYPEKPEISDCMRDFFKRILCKDPEKRIKAEEIKNHKWIKD